MGRWPEVTPNSHGTPWLMESRTGLPLRRWQAIEKKVNNLLDTCHKKDIDAEGRK